MAEHRELPPQDGDPKAFFRLVIPVARRVHMAPDPFSACGDEDAAELRSTLPALTSWDLHFQQPLLLPGTPWCVSGPTFLGFLRLILIGLLIRSLKVFVLAAAHGLCALCSVPPTPAHSAPAWLLGRRISHRPGSGSSHPSFLPSQKAQGHGGG